MMLSFESKSNTNKDIKEPYSSASTSQHACVVVGISVLDGTKVPRAGTYHTSRGNLWRNAAGWPATDHANAWLYRIIHKQWNQRILKATVCQGSQRSTVGSEITQKK